MSANNVVIIEKGADGKFRGYHRDRDAYLEGRYDESTFCSGKSIFEVNTIEEAIYVSNRWIEKMNEAGFYIEYGYEFVGLKPNQKTVETIEKAERGEDLDTFGSVEELIMDLEEEDVVCSFKLPLNCVPQLSGTFRLVDSSGKVIDYDIGRKDGNFIVRAVNSYQQSKRMIEELGKLLQGKDEEIKRLKGQLKVHRKIGDESEDEVLQLQTEVKLLKKRIRDNLPTSVVMCDKCGRGYKPSEGCEWCKLTTEVEELNNRLSKIE
jgi:hypothetical protein